MKSKLRFLIPCFFILVSSQAIAQNALPRTNVSFAQNDCKPQIGWIPMPCAKHDANLIPENIKTGVTIFGVQGNFPSPETVNAAKAECFSVCSIPGYIGIGAATPGMLTTC